MRYVLQIDEVAYVTEAKIYGFRKAQKAGSPKAASPHAKAGLLDLDLGTGILELLLEGLGIGLGNRFLDGLRGAVDEVLGFLQA